MFCVDIQDRQVRHRTSGNANQFTLMPLPQIADNSGINAGIKEAVWACWRFASVAGEGREAVFCEAERAIHREHRTHRGISKCKNPWKPLPGRLSCSCQQQEAHLHRRPRPGSAFAF
jgi:hypothetical protein